MLNGERRPGAHNECESEISWLAFNCARFIICIRAVRRSIWSPFLSVRRLGRRFCLAADIGISIRRTGRDGHPFDPQIDATPDHCIQITFHYESEHNTARSIAAANRKSAALPFLRDTFLISSLYFARSTDFISFPVIRVER